MGMTYNEVCDTVLKKAQSNNLSDPDFDFRHYYSKGEIIYYVYNSDINSPFIKELKINTVYPRIITAAEDKGMIYSIDYRDRDCIFRIKRDADEYYSRQKTASNTRRSE